MSFTPIAALPDAAPDPTKHVNYTLGMVLGVDDFTQEFTYLSSRDQALAGVAVGSGTTSGLQVTVSPGDHGSAGIVRVSSGNAVSPGGQLVSVPTPQCGDLDLWLQANATAASDAVTAGSPPEASLTLYVLLAYADAQTDAVPIPPDPNSTTQSLTAPSRVQDSFQLQFSTTAPAVDTGQADADFVDWLGQLQYATSSSSTIDDLLSALATAASPSSPPAWPPPTWAPPPSSLVIPRGQAVAYLRAAIAAWVTQLRPALEAESGVTAVSAGATGTDATTGPPADALVVATLSVPLVAGSDPAPQASGPATIVDGGQSVVLPQQLVRELALASAVPPAPPAQAGLGTTVAVGRFELERQTDGGEVELRPEFAHNLHAALEPRPGTDAKRAEREIARAHEHYIRLGLEHGYERRHDYVITAVPLVEAHGARYAVEQISDPPHHGVGSHSGPFMLRLSPVVEGAHSLRVGLTVQITDFGPRHPRHAS